MQSKICCPCDEERKCFSIPDIIYHYTSPDGMINIIDKKEIWFSRFDSLNDISEGKYINDIYNMVIDNLNRDIDNHFLMDIEGRTL